MDCKIVRKDIIENKFTKEVNEHLLQCSDCLSFKENHHKLESELSNTYSAGDQFKSRKSDIMGSIQARRKKRHLPLIAILVLVTLTIAFADELLLSGELLTYFRPDASATAARENDYPIEDFIMVEDGYTLYVKDFYFDPYHGEMKIALEKDGEYIKGFSYGVRFDGLERYWRDERNESTPWNTVYVGSLDNKDLTINIGVKVDGKEIYFDDINLLQSQIKNIEPKIITCNDVIETDYGNITFDRIEIYPTAMYLMTSYDFDDSVFMFHLNDMKFVDNNGNSYEQQLFSNRLNDEKTQFFRMLGTIYMDDSVTSLTITLGEVKVKYFKELINQPYSKLNNYEFVYKSRYDSQTYTMNDVTLDDEYLKLSLTLKEPTSHAAPIHIAIHDQGKWTFLEVLEEVSAPLPKDEQMTSIPNYILSDWLGYDVYSASYENHKWTIDNRETSDEYHKYRQAFNYFTRTSIEQLINENDLDISEDQLDLIFSVVDNETQWFNVVDLELISGLSLEELKNSDEGKVKLIEYLKQYYEYRNLLLINQFIDSVEEYGSLGIGGHKVENQLKTIYGAQSTDSTIELGTMEVYTDHAFRFEYEVD